MKEKIIIAVVGKSNAGKTSAIRKLADCFPFSSVIDRKDYDYDFTIVGNFVSPQGGEIKTLGICSMGDYISGGLDVHFLQMITKYHCDVIVAPCHNYHDVGGNTYKYLDDMAGKHGYKFLTTSIIRDDSIPYKSLEEWKADGGTEVQVNGISLNEIFAHNMMNLINALT